VQHSPWENLTSPGKPKLTRSRACQSQYPPRRWNWCSTTKGSFDKPETEQKWLDQLAAFLAKLNTAE
jgi:hypothetical protein